jgi:23S rRNA pseudouridine2605 synthase
MQERLQKLIAQAGIASRRAAEELIREGAVSVNGKIAELGTKADPESDHIKVHGKLINKKLEKRANVYILLNKPKGYLSSAADPEGRKLVTDLVKNFGKVHPVGRLDYNTEGLIILTNDGEFTNKVASSKTFAKVYEVKVKGLPNENAINKLRRGILLEDGFKTAPAEIKELKHTENNGWYEVTLYEGHNQQIRKMFDAIGNSVVKLRRTSIGHVKDERIPVGAYRELDEDEVRQFLNPVPPKPVKKPIAKEIAPPKRAQRSPNTGRKKLEVKRTKKS